MSATILNCNLGEWYQKSYTFRILEYEFTYETVDETDKAAARIIETGQVYKNAVQFFHLVKVRHKRLRLRRTVADLEISFEINCINDISFDSLD